MDWLNVTAETGLWGLLLGSFLSATLLPGGSEAMLWGFLSFYPDDWASALVVATLGNTAGGMTSWCCGRYLPRWQRLASLPQADRLARWGSPALLLAWLPVVGDALCLAAGWLRMHWLPCALFMALGKALRYGLIARAALP